MQSDIEQRRQLANINRSLSCPNEPNFRTINGKCYLFVSEKKTYLEAKAYCEGQVAKATIGKLFEPRTAVTNILVYEAMIEGKGAPVVSLPHDPKVVGLNLPGNCFPALKLPSHHRAFIL